MKLISSILQALSVRLSAIALVGAVLLPASSGAASINANPSNYRNVLASLNAGDTMMLEAGAYTSGLPISNKSGTAAQPIVVTGPDDQSAIFTANDCCNTVQLQDVGYLEIRNLTLNGAGTNGAFGVDARGTSHDVTIENLKIINYGGDQQVVGISTKGPAWNWVMRRNTIIGAGTGQRWWLRRWRSTDALGAAGPAGTYWATTSVRRGSQPARSRTAGLRGSALGG